MKKGKRLEYIAKIIQETLKDSPRTIVHPNYKIKNTAGNKREFDVFIESEINGNAFNIAVECKDHKSSISVEKMEAFITKCARVPSINKKIFISSKGFQKDAISAAEEYGVELFVASQVNQNSVICWFPITELEIKILTGGHPNFFLDAEDEEINSLRYDLNQPILFNGNKILINDYINEIFKCHKTQILDLASSIWAALPIEHRGDPFFVPVGWKPEELYLQCDKKNIRVTSIEMKYQLQFLEVPMQTKDAYDIKYNDGTGIAQTISTQLETDTEANFVTTKDRKTVLHINGPVKDRSNFRFISFSPTETRIIRLGNG